MDRFLSLPLNDRRQAFEQAGVARGLSTRSVEKDFWVCVALRELFTLPEYKEHLTFKGGTSLSKAWNLIDRFSEDIDLTLVRDALGFGGTRGPEEAKSGKERQRRLDGLRQACRSCVAQQIKPALFARFGEIIPAAEEWTLLPDEADPDAQTLLFAYPRFGSADSFGYVKPVVRLEFGARSDPWPVEVRAVVSIVGEEFPGLFGTPSCSVRALVPERTFWEKVMLLHEETFRPADKRRRAGLARHYYDLWCMIKKGVAPRAVEEIELFDRVAAHRQLYFRQNWVPYETLKRGTIRLLPPSHQLAEWRQDYAAMRGEMFLGEPPSFDQVLGTIGELEAEINRG